MIDRSKIFDSHIHIPGSRGEVFHEGFGKRIRNLEELVGVLDRWGIDKGVINSTVSTVSKTPEEFIRGNREVLQVLKDYPGRFWGSCTVNPLFLKEALEELEICRERFGFPWLGEMCPYLGDYSVNSEEMFRVIERASELDFVIHVHGPTWEELEKIASEFPEITLVLAHLAGLGREDKKRFEIIAQHENYYLDIAGSAIVYWWNLELAIELIGVDRILFGSDLIIAHPLPTIARVENLDISRADKEKIFWRNLDKLLKDRL